MNLPFHSGKIFQEYVVSAYMKVEANDLNWIRHNQKKLRIETYKGINLIELDCTQFINILLIIRIVGPCQYAIHPSKYT